MRLVSLSEGKMRTQICAEGGPQEDGEDSCRAKDRLLEQILPHSPLKKLILPTSCDLQSCEKRIF